jgi:hypothetical protein
MSWYHKLPIKILFLIFFKGAGRPLGSKRAQGCPLVAEGCDALLKMPSRSTNLRISSGPLWGGGGVTKGGVRGYFPPDARPLLRALLFLAAIVVNNSGGCCWPSGLPLG